MSTRTSIDLPGFSHVNPIPAASRIGPFVATGAITGRDPVTGEVAPDADQQFAHVFAHVRTLMAELGGSTDDILKITFHLADPDDREALNREWLAMFPDPDSRPARQAIAARLGRGAVVHCDLLAVLST
ncbi:MULTISPECIES: Rid family hydrolase [unclassified Streptomyces]|uniref:RidA family protein n=1 Tax=unclassified Streptomyces TaxID=2593676 RepID=UPI00035FDD18|nr:MULTISPECIES: Rid family hydrolase [unclassified Streptomyces]MYY04536.1 RidA family protein [Streptomyces sp. SID4913]